MNCAFPTCCRPRRVLRSVPRGPFKGPHSELNSCPSFMNIPVKRSRQMDLNYPNGGFAKLGALFVGVVTESPTTWGSLLEPLILGNFPFSLIISPFQRDPELLDKHLQGRSITQEAPALQAFLRYYISLL